MLGVGTGVFEDLTAYLSSLERLAKLTPGRLYCGHGPPVDDGVAKLADYIAHRKKRIDQVATALSGGVGPRSLAG